MAARAGWSLTTERVVKSPEVQWTMNCSLAEIGIHFPKHRKRALAVGYNRQDSSNIPKG